MKETEGGLEEASADQSLGSIEENPSGISVIKDVAEESGVDKMVIDDDANLKKETTNNAVDTAI